MAYKTLIIDDESLARDIVKEYLKSFPEIEILAECSDGFCGVKKIQELRPDLIFLDIQMPKLTGFEMLELLDYKPEIIFITAFDEYALKAFEMNAMDYLLKPYSQERFTQAVGKAIEFISNKKSNASQINKLVDEGNYHPDSLERVVVKTGQKINVIPVSELIYLEAMDDYVSLYTKEKRYLKQKTMKYFEEHLPDEYFVRVHRSFIVAIDQIKQLEQYEKDSYILILKNDTKIKVSRSGLKSLKEKLNF